jgi:ribonuclease Z
MTLIADLERMQVFSFPLVHRIPTCGFLVREKQKQRNIKPEAIERYNIPFVRIRQIKAGADLALEDGHVVPNHEITIDPPAPRSYAFCSDTAFSEKTAAYVQGVDLLYHESTFIEAQRERAVKTCHSTAAQAAQVAKAAGASKLLLGHFSARYRKLEPFLIEACPIFPQSELAIEGSTIPIGPVHK